MTSLKTDSAQLLPADFIADLTKSWEGPWANAADTIVHALRAQAASPADMAVYQGIADGYQRDAQAASVEPVVRITVNNIRNHIDEIDVLRRLPKGVIDLYAGAPPAHIPANHVLVRRDQFEQFTNWMALGQTVAASSPATAVDAVDEREQIETAFASCVDHQLYMELPEHLRQGLWSMFCHGFLKAQQARTALQASRQPVTQQAVAEGAEDVSDDDIRRIFLINGFTVKDGQTDLKPYVFQAARALLALATKEQRS